MRGIRSGRLVSPVAVCSVTIPLAGDVPSDHIEKFVNYGLARKQFLLLYITPLGQIELFRQRFQILQLPVPQFRSMLSARRARPLLLDQVLGGV